MRFTLSIDTARAFPGAEFLDGLALLIMRQAATLDGLASVPRGAAIADDTGAIIGAWQLADDKAPAPHALAFWWDWELQLAIYPTKEAAEAACLKALNEGAETDCATLEDWQALDWCGRPWDYRITPVQGPGLTPSRADLLDAAGALREVANNRRGEADTLEAYSASDAQSLRDVAPLYEETADRLEAVALAMPKPEAPSPSGADLEAPEGPSDDQYREAARAQYGCDGKIEIDPGAPVSRGDDPGAYVQAWVWVYNDDIGERER